MWSFLIKMKKRCSIVVACTHDGGIGSQGRVPWHLPSDLHFFRQLTTNTADPEKQNACIMGKATFLSLEKPLSRRLNIVITNHPNDLPPNVLGVSSLTQAIHVAINRVDVESLFIIGGESVYREALEHSLCDQIYMTRIVGLNAQHFQCDRFFPLHYGAYFQPATHPTNIPIHFENGLHYQIIVYSRTH